MRYVFKGFFGARIRFLFTNILFSLVIAGVFWFFTHVLFGNELDFGKAWKDTYIVIYALDLFLSTLGILSRIIYGLYYSNKFQASFADVEEALVDYNMLKKPGHEEWTAEQFRTHLMIGRMSRDLATALLKSFADR